MLSSVRSSRKLAKYKLRVTRTFEKDFRKFDLQTKRRIDSTVRILETDPHAGKPLRADLAGKWSIRTGDYRVIYQINEEGKRVLLYHAMHRKKVYR